MGEHALSLSFCETVVPFCSARIESRTSLSFSICFGRRKFFIPDLILFAMSLFIKSPMDNKFKLISAHTETLRNPNTATPTNANLWDQQTEIWKE